MALILVFAGCRAAADDRDVDVPEVVDYNWHVRPILSANCYVCHGPDISTREAGLRLDLRDSAIVVLESGNAAIVPGDSRRSELIRRVASTDPEERMPPEEMKKILTPREVAILAKWIDQGAEWKPHWALIPPAHVPPLGWFSRKSTIDRYLDARLAEHDLKPAPKASKAALIRRLSYVLTGLPPTPEGVASFLADASPDAYEQLVDRLLASPQFGERWARHWMDLVRYADTRGHEFDFPVVGAWRYRDYLIRAFNADVPYDRLILEHLAGDLLETPRRHPDLGFNESILGTAFFALGEGKHSPVDLRIDEAERIDNIIDVTGKTFQGLTVACAKCHDHKFDPIPTTDYYAWYGIVKSSRFAIRNAETTPAQEALVGALDALNGAIRDLFAAQWRDDAAAVITAETERAASPPVRLAALDAPRNDAPSVGLIGDFRRGNFDGWFVDGLAFGDRPVARPVLDAAGRLVELAGPRASSARYSTRLVGALRSPTFVLEEPYITVRAAGRGAHARIVIDNFHLIRYPIYGGLEAAIDSAGMRSYRFDVQMWKGHEAYVEVMPGRYDQHEYVKDDSAYVDVEYVAAHAGEAFEAPPADSPGRPGLGEAIDAWQRGVAGPAHVARIDETLQSGLLSRDVDGMDEVMERRREIESALSGPAVFMGMVDGTGRDQPVFIRGSTQNPSPERVPRRHLTILDASRTPFAGPGSGRLQWARGMADPANPLTARVMVNRIWHHVFGRGIVETVDNFGVQGRLPSHPELLDYLAIRFVEQGWSVKKMIREMVLTEAFQRSSRASERSQRLDPDNVWLQHYPVRRLEAEAIRDAILAVSGRLDPAMYGPPVPVHLSDFMEGRGRPKVSGPLDGAGRRSIYQSIRRNFLSPMMLVFDMPIPFTTFGRRNTSNVPAQSLTLLNDPFVVDQAAYRARNVIVLKELSVEEKIGAMYRTAFGRDPTTDELNDGIDFLEEQAGVYGTPRTILHHDPRPWKEYAHALFNMKEFIYLL